MTTSYIKFLLLLFILNISTIVNADDPPGSEYGYKNNILPPSPTAADFSRMAEIQSETATGVPNISIPLFSLQLDELTIPITASYNAGGIKVEQLPGNIGLGWSLNVGGNISRVMHQLPDETPNVGYIDYVENMPPRQVILSDPRNDDIKQIFEELSSGQFDLEPDVFHYSFPGGSGKFAFGKDKAPHTFPNEPIKIHGYESNIDQTGFTEFYITGSNGYKYVYNNPEITTSVRGGSPADIYYSSWFLGNIESPFSDKTCTFQYDPVEYNSISYPQESVTIKWEGSPAQYNPIAIEDHSTIVHHNTYSLKKIVTETHTLNFHYRLFQSKYFIIDSLVINTMFNDQEEYLKTITFNYEEVASRHMLKTIHFQREGKDLQPPYQFTYNSMVLPVSTNASEFRGQDYWGYYNGVNTNSTLIPPLKDGSDLNVHSWANREPVEQYMKAQSLESITYPSGGYTYFEFEAHDRAKANTQYCNDKETLIKLHAEGCCETFNSGHSIPLPETSISTYEYYYPHWLPEQEAECYIHLTKVDDIDNIVAGFQKVFPKISITDKTTGKELVIYPKQSEDDFYITYNFQSGHEYKFEAKAYYSDQIQAGIRVGIVHNPLKYNFSENVIVGGLRIKSIQTYDGYKKTLKNFNYNKPNSNSSSGILLSEPIYVYYIKELECPNNDCSNLDDRQNFNLSKVGFVENSYVKKSSPVYPIGIQNGSHVVYKTISIIEENSEGEKHKIENSYSTDMDKGGGFPFIPLNDFSWARGKLLNQKSFIYDSELDSYFLKKEIFNEYSFHHRFSDFDKINIEGLKVSKRSMQIPYAPSLYTVNDAFDWSYYNYPTTCKLLSHTVENRYDDNKLVFSNTTEYIYSNPKYPLLTEKIIKTSEGKCTMMEYRYPFDLVEEKYFHVVEDYLSLNSVDCNIVYNSCIGPNNCLDLLSPCSNTYSECYRNRVEVQLNKYPHLHYLYLDRLFPYIPYGVFMNLVDCEKNYNDCIEASGYLECAAEKNCEILAGSCHGMFLYTFPIQLKWKTTTTKIGDRTIHSQSTVGNGIADKFFNISDNEKRCRESWRTCYKSFNCHGDYLACKRENEAVYSIAYGLFENNLNSIMSSSSTDSNVAGLIHMYINNIIGQPIETITTKIDSDGESNIIHSTLKNYETKNNRFHLANEVHFFPEKQSNQFYYASINTNDELVACENQETVKLLAHNDLGNLAKYAEYMPGSQNTPTFFDINYLEDKVTPVSICKSKMDLTHFYIDFTSESEDLTITCNSNHIQNDNLSNSTLPVAEDHYYALASNETILINFSNVSDQELLQPYIFTINSKNSNVSGVLDITCKLENQTIQSSKINENAFDNHYQSLYEYNFSPATQNNNIIIEIINNGANDIYIDDISFAPVHSNLNCVSYNKFRMPAKTSQNQSLSKFIYSEDLKLQETRNINEFLMTANTYNYISEPLLEIKIDQTRPEVDTWLDFSINHPVEDLNISSIEWIFDETNTTSVLTPSLKFQDPGKHTATAIITFQNNEIKIVRNTFYIYPKSLSADINVSSSGSYIGQFNTEVTVTITNPNLPVGNYIVECVWDVTGSNFYSDTITSQNGLFKFYPQNLGYIPIRAIFKDNEGNKGFTETEICVLKCQEDIDFVLQNTMVHYGETATFNIVNNGSCYVPQKYIWDFGDGTQKTETTSTNIQHSYDKPGIYNVTMQFYDQGYVLHTTTKSIEINNFPITATVNFPQGLNFEASTSMSLSNLLGGYGAYSVRWEYYLESTDTTLVTPTNIWLTVDQNNNTSAILNWNPEFCGNEVQLRCRIYDDVNSRTIYTSDFIHVLGSGCFH